MDGSRIRCMPRRPWATRRMGHLAVQPSWGRSPLDRRLCVPRFREVYLSQTWRAAAVPTARAHAGLIEVGSEINDRPCAELRPSRKASRCGVATCVGARYAQHAGPRVAPPRAGAARREGVHVPTERLDVRLVASRTIALFWAAGGNALRPASSRRQRTGAADGRGSRLRARPKAGAARTEARGRDSGDQSSLRRRLISSCPGNLSPARAISSSSLRACPLSPLVRYIFARARRMP